MCLHSSSDRMVRLWCELNVKYLCNHKIGRRYGGRGGKLITKATASPAPPAPPQPPIQFTKVAVDVLEEDLEGEAQEGYLQYSMSVIVGRALPDVRDGLKPVQRRILYAMHDMKLNHNGPFRKSARVVGEVLGKLHPHGDSSVYEAMVRMAQEFSLRVPLVNGHGNFGSVDGDPPAAMRYTECKLQPVTEAMFLQDVGEYSVDYVPNFDDSQKEPSILPARLPQLLLNGSTGIAVGYATEIPPHNLGEIVDGIEAFIKNPDISTEELMTHIKGPDFPTGALILGSGGIKDMFETGGGTITMRAKGEVETYKVKNKSRERVVFTEVPFNVNKAEVVTRIAAAAQEGIIMGVDSIQDESGRNGIRVVIEVKPGFPGEQVMNQIFKHTRFQRNYSAKMVALVDGSPQMLNMKQILAQFVNFRYGTIQRVYGHMLSNLQSRLHIVEGLQIAQKNSTKVLEIMQNEGTAEALMQQLGLTQEQANAIMDMRIRSFTKLEANKLADETNNLEKNILSTLDILNSKDKAMKLIIKEAKDISKKYSSPRRSEILENVSGHLSLADLVQNEASIVTLSRRGYVKRMSPQEFSVQRRGGRGKAGTSLKGDDTMLDILQVMTHDDILFFTEGGHAYSTKAYNIPAASRTAQGSAVAQVVSKNIQSGVLAMLPGVDIDKDDRLVLLSKKGLMKQTALSQFEKLNEKGLCAIKLNQDDELLAVQRCTPGASIVMASNSGQVLHINEDQLLMHSRTAKGCKGMRIKKPENCLVGMSVLPPELQSQFVDESYKEEEEDEESGDDLSPHEDDVKDVPSEQLKDGPWTLIITKQGYGMRQPMKQFKKQRKGRMGLKALKLRKDDEVKGFLVIGKEQQEDDLVVASVKGIITRMQISSVPILNRGQAKGVRIMKMDQGDEIQTVQTVQKKQNGEEEEQKQTKKRSKKDQTQAEEETNVENLQQVEQNQ